MRRAMSPRHRAELRPVPTTDVTRRVFELMQRVPTSDRPAVYRTAITAARSVADAASAVELREIRAAYQREKAAEQAASAVGPSWSTLPAELEPNVCGYLDAPSLACLETSHGLGGRAPRMWEAKAASLDRGSLCDGVSAKQLVAMTVRRCRAARRVEAAIARGRAAGVPIGEWYAPWVAEKVRQAPCPEMWAGYIEDVMARKIEGTFNSTEMMREYLERAEGLTFATASVPARRAGSSI